jgi:hypothetical protein
LALGQVARAVLKDFQVTHWGLSHLGPTRYGPANHAFVVLSRMVVGSGAAAKRPAESLPAVPCSRFNYTFASMSWEVAALIAERVAAASSAAMPAARPSANM